MSAILQMPNREQDDPILIPVTERIKELEAIVRDAEAELKTLREFRAKRTMPFAGKPLQDCIRTLLGEHPTMQRDDLITEAVKRGAAFGTRQPSANVSKSLDVMIDAGAVKEHGGKVTLKE